MSSRRGGLAKGPPKHQNRTSWKPDCAVKKKDRELGGNLHPYPAITGVCPRCKSQIEWRRKYGKYKALTAPAKCNKCGKRAVRQAYHALCAGCASERNVCAKCCLPSETIVGRNAEKEEGEQKELEKALKNLRERDRRTLLRAMSHGKSKAAIQVLGSDTSKVEHEADKDTEENSDFEELEESGSCCSEEESDASQSCDEDSSSQKGEASVKELDLQLLSLRKDEG